MIPETWIVNTLYRGKGSEKMPIYFYKEFGPLGYLASYSQDGFYCNGVYYQTTEHFFQAQKFDDEIIKKQIIKAKYPKIASEIGRKRSNVPRKNWKKIKDYIMYDAVLMKFRANTEIAKKLLATGDDEIVEETVKENYWGCGPNYDGKNIYGKILCAVRNELRSEKGRKRMLISRQGYAKLEKEARNLEYEIAEVQKQMGESVKRDNDLRENPEFMELRAKAMYDLPKKKDMINHMLAEAVIIQETEAFINADLSTVFVGATVELEVDEEKEIYTILGSNESELAEDAISYDTPFAKAILGAKLNQVVEFRGMKIKIIMISKNI